MPLSISDRVADTIRVGPRERVCHTEFLQEVLHYCVLCTDVNLSLSRAVGNVHAGQERVYIAGHECYYVRAEIAMAFGSLVLFLVVADGQVLKGTLELIGSSSACCCRRRSRWRRCSRRSSSPRRVEAASRGVSGPTLSYGEDHGPILTTQIRVQQAARAPLGSFLLSFATCGRCRSISPPAILSASSNWSVGGRNFRRQPRTLASLAEGGIAHGRLAFDVNFAEQVIEPTAPEVGLGFFLLIALCSFMRFACSFCFCNITACLASSSARCAKSCIGCFCCSRFSRAFASGNLCLCLALLR